MKWVVDKSQQTKMYEWQRMHMPFYLAHRRTPTTEGRVLDFYLVEQIAAAADAISFLGPHIDKTATLAAVGLTCPVVYERGATMRYHPSIDAVVLVSVRDSGFVRGAKAQRITAAHEAMHAGMAIARRTHQLSNNAFPWNIGIEETCAHWTGVFADIFIETVMAHHRGVT